MALRFMGTYRHNLDDKFRLTIPAKFRAKLQETVIVNGSYSNHLELRTDEGFDLWLEELESYSKFDAKVSDLKTSIAANSNEVEIDGSGRVKLEKTQLEKINITKEVLLIGAFDHIELWDPQTREQYERDLLPIENAMSALSQAKLK